MIDWLSLHCLYDNFPDPLPAVNYRNMLPQLMKWNPATGEVEWCKPTIESIRSDSHQVTVAVAGDRISIWGSPARSMGLRHNVFGSADIVECALAHIRVAREHLPFELPDIEHWFPSRIDVTHNYDLGGPVEVRQALTYLRQADGGRLKVNSKYAETVYWNENSTINARKAYAKGSHLEYQLSKGQIDISQEELQYAHRLLRLENKRGNEWWRRFRQSGRDWKTVTEQELNAIHRESFESVIGKDSIEVTEMDSILERLKELKDEKTGKAISEARALGAYRTWGLIKMVGMEEAKASMSERTWRYHKAMLFAAGLSWSDFAAGNVVPFRRKTILLGEPVTSFEQLRKAA
ncbi:phage/plasmid replication protein, II/X family [Methylococcus mesophilus]|uniref:phage/plasmid replication protein, II/X family n=1 Tax=Methylococcus mesophilus TaxID=2993564 RepID=UPI00224B346B|nr:phage/plasmid replication protein, II/X family [Methylococcus mesophilus]UZR29438.1 phage/plasmid replication protein, II/X family [Methylococcus mesophilus]